MELFYTYLLLAGILLVISIFSGLKCLMSDNNYDETRFVEFIAAAVITLLFCLGHYISARIKENKNESEKNTNQRPPSR